MSRPNSTAPRRTLRMIALMAMLAALLGIVATGCGTSDDRKSGDKQEQSDEATDATSTDGEKAPAEGDAAAGDESDSTSTDEADADESDSTSTDEADADGDAGAQDASDEEPADEDA